VLAGGVTSLEGVSGTLEPPLPPSLDVLSPPPEGDVAPPLSSVVVVDSVVVDEVVVSGAVCGAGADDGAFVLSLSLPQPAKASNPAAVTNATAAAVASGRRAALTRCRRGLLDAGRSRGSR
jgi:hypothetical protein